MLYDLYLPNFPTYIIGLLTGFVYLFIICEQKSWRFLILKSNSFLIGLITFLSIVLISSIYLWLFKDFLYYTSHLETNYIFNLFLFITSLILSFYFFGFFKFKKTKFEDLNFENEVI